MSKLFIPLIIIFVVAIHIVSQSVFAAGSIWGKIQAKSDASITVSQDGKGVVVPLLATTQLVSRNNSIVQKNDVAVGDFLLQPQASGSSTIYVYKSANKGQQKHVYGILTGFNDQIATVLEEGKKDTYISVTVGIATVTETQEGIRVPLAKTDIGKKVLVIGKIEQDAILTGTHITVFATESAKPL